MKKFTTFIGLVAAIACTEDFLKVKPITAVGGSVKVEEKVSAEKSTDFDLKKSNSLNHQNSENKTVAKNFSDTDKESSKVVTDDENTLKESDYHKKSATKSCNGSGTEDLENQKHFNASARQGELASAIKFGNFANHKSLEVNHEFTESAEHIESHKENDCEKVNSKKWTKKRHQKKNFNSNNANHKRDHVIKTKGKGVSKHANEEQKDSKLREAKRQEADDYSNIQKKKVFTDVDTSKSFNQEKHFDKSYNSVDNEQHADTANNNFSLNVSTDKKAEVDKTFQDSWAKTY